MTRRPPVDIDVFACPLAGTNLIEASAGTGKTWTLSGLYLRCLLEAGHPVERILVVTYTKAATAELRERIRARLTETLGVLDGMPAGADPFVAGLLAALRGRGLAEELLRSRLGLALAAFDQAAIFTIHSFCQRALGDTPIAGNVPLQLELVPDDSELLQRAVADAWRRHVGNAALPRALAAHLLEHPLTPETVAPLLRRRMAKSLAREIWPEAAPPAGDLAAFRQDFAALQAQWPDWRDAARTLLLAQDGSIHRGSYKPETIERCFDEWDRWLAADATQAGAPPLADKLVLLTTSKLVEKTGKGKTTPQHPCFDAADALLSAWQAIAGDLDAAWRALLKQMLDDAEARLRDDKRRRRVAGYDDLLGNLHHALHTDPARAAGLVAELRQRYPVALIDEFQDTDPLQWAIFARVWTPAVNGAGDAVTLFLVGDPKQAIYRFRHADVHTYLGARASCTTEYTLSQNQRSRAPMIGAVNAVFGAHAAAFMREGLDFHATTKGSKPCPAWEAPAALAAGLQVWLLPQVNGTAIEYGAAKEAALAASAAEIARLIGDGAAATVRIDGRGLMPRDIAVLVRSHAQARAMRAALAALGVDSVELAQESVFHSREAAEVGIVLAAIAEPQDERRLRAALATELVGLDALAIAALGDEAQNPDGLAAHVERFSRYRDQWRGPGFAPMWRALLAGEQVVPRLLQLPDGERRLTNLLHLGELLQAQARALGAGDAFLRWFAEQHEEAGDSEEAALRLESDRDLVQIVTVHKSKGLEYPVVFCPLLWAETKHGGDGLIAGAEYRDGATSVIDFRGDEEIAALAAQAARREAAEEDLRLIYVALTRAVQRCYLVAGVTSRYYFGRPSTKAGRRRILNWLVAGGGTAPDEWLEWDKKIDARLDDAVIEAAWNGLAADSGISIATLPLAAGQALPAARPDAAALSVRPWTRQLDEAWRIGSFSGLMRQGAHAAPEAGGADRDEALALLDPAVPAAADPDDDAAPAAAPGDDDILRFPRGATAGECLHAIFEHADFGAPASWPQAIADALRRFPVAPPGADNDARLATMAATMLRDVCATELAPGVRLVDVPPSRRLNELAFNFPADVRSADIEPLLTELGYPMPPLEGGGRLRGYLGGFIDLVFEADGRFWVLDWKSNHLGDTAADYGRRGVGTAMAAHGYHLQSLIYSVAVHRYLGLRLPGYDYRQHFGGILYLFVRGVRPGWRDAAGQPCGVWQHKPEPEAIAAIEALLTRD